MLKAWGRIHSSLILAAAVDTDMLNCLYQEKSPSVRVSTGKSTEMGTSFHTMPGRKERKKNKGNLYREDLKRAEVRCPGTKEREESF